MLRLLKEEKTLFLTERNPKNVYKNIYLCVIKSRFIVSFSKIFKLRSTFLILITNEISVC